MQNYNVVMLAGAIYGRALQPLSGLGTGVACLAWPAWGVWPSVEAWSAVGGSDSVHRGDCCLPVV